MSIKTLKRYNGKGNSKKSMKRRGGAKVGEGSFGCVYRPALKCVGDQERPLKTISKLSSKKDAETEYQENKIVRNLDPNYQYHISPWRICPPATPDKEHDNEFKDCRHAVKSDKPWEESLRVLQMEDGGKDLSEYVRSSIHQNKGGELMRNLLLSMENIYNGLILFNKHDFIHMDIKSNNLVINERQTRGYSPYHIRFIDFGLSLHVKHGKDGKKDTSTRNSLLEYRLANGYYIRPFELSIYDDMVRNYENDEKDIRTNFELLVDYLQGETSKPSKKLIKKYKARLEETYGQRHMREKSRSFYKGKGSFFSRPRIELKKSLKNLYSMFHEHSRDTVSLKRKVESYMNNIISKTIDSYSFHTMLLSIWKIIYPEERFTEKPLPTWSKEMSMFYHLIMNATLFYHKKRPSIYESYAEYMKLKNYLLQRREFRIYNHSQSQKGGAKVGEGGYGCVYRPPLQCENEPTRREGVIAKLMTIHDAQEEYDETKKIEQIDPEHRFHLPRPDMCKPKPLDPEIDGHLHDCEPLVDRGIHEMDPRWREKVKLLLYKDGGIDLKTFIKSTQNVNVLDPSNNDKKRQVLVLFMNMINICSGIAKMVEHDYSHNDIKEANIVLNVEDMLPRFIDFGLAHDYKDKEDMETRAVYMFADVLYYLIPLELQLYRDDEFHEGKNRGMTETNEQLFDDCIYYTYNQTYPDFFTEQEKSQFMSESVYHKSLRILALRINDWYFKRDMYSQFDDTYNSRSPSIYFYTRDLMQQWKEKEYMDMEHFIFLIEQCLHHIVSNKNIVHRDNEGNIMMNKEEWLKNIHEIERKKDIFAFGILLCSLWNSYIHLYNSPLDVLFNKDTSLPLHETHHLYVDIVRDCLEFNSFKRKSAMEIVDKYSNFAMKLYQMIQNGDENAFFYLDGIHPYTEHGIIRESNENVNIRFNPPLGNMDGSSSSSSGTSSTSTSSSTSGSSSSSGWESSSSYYTPQTHPHKSSSSSGWSSSSSSKKVSQPISVEKPPSSSSSSGWSSSSSSKKVSQPKPKPMSLEESTSSTPSTGWSGLSYSST